MSAYIQANTDGQLHDARQPSLSPLDRGFLYGDAVYEVWRTYRGAIFGWEEHLERLRASAAALALELPWDEARLLSEIRRTAAAFRAHTAHAGELYIRLQVTRGAGAIGLDTALADRPLPILLVQKLKELSAREWEEGLRLSVATALRRNPPDSLNPAWKTGNYLNNLLCLREARQRGADEVVILNHRGEVTEAAVSNLAFVRGSEVVTPPASAGILLGITRRRLLERHASGPGWTLREAAVPSGDLGSFDECFICSTTRDLVPVGSIDGCRYRTGPGTLTRTIKESFQAAANAEAAARTDLLLP